MFGLSKLAKQVTGKVSGFKAILNYTPQLSPFILPPQVSMGLKVANTLGLKIPSPDDLVAMANGVIRSELTKLRQPINQTLDKLEPGLLSSIKKAESIEEAIQQIEWLL